MVDDDDYEGLLKYKWYASQGRNHQPYAIRWIWVPEKRNNRFVKMHRQLTGATLGEKVDHINHDTLDNRKENLRICTDQQNQGNEVISVNNTSGFKGVSWRKDRQKWRAYIAIDQKQISLGHFKNKKSAALAYNDAANKFFKEFALLNYIK
mgnify:CR=1 FL=1